MINLTSCFRLSMTSITSVFCNFFCVHFLVLTSVHHLEPGTFMIAFLSFGPAVIEFTFLSSVIILKKFLKVLVCCFIRKLIEIFIINIEFVKIKIIINQIWILMFFIHHCFSESINVSFYWAYYLTTNILVF